MRPCESKHCGYPARVEVLRVTDEEAELVGDPLRWKRIICKTEVAGEYCHLHAEELTHDNEYVLGEDL